MGIGSSVIPADKHIVIVGAGYGGALLGMELLKSEANFTIISSSDCFHHNVAVPRAIVESGFSDKSLIPLAKSFGKHFKHDKVVGMKPDEKKIVLESGDDLAYDILVIATGAKRNHPLKLCDTNTAEALDMYKKEVEKIRAADRVVIVGGGPTGVETAAEVAFKYPDKEVTLIHNQNDLVAKDLSEKSQKSIRAILDEMKVKVIPGERVTNLEELNEEGPYTLTTDKEATIEADYVLKSVGLAVTTEAYENGLAEAMDENGRLRVNKFLQVAGHEECIYALGDCNNVNEVKNALNAMEQGKVLLKTIRSVLGGGKPVAYKIGSSPLKTVVSLGPNMAVGELANGISLPGFLIARIKSRDMLCGKYWKELGQTCPS